MWSGMLFSFLGGRGIWDAAKGNMTKHESYCMAREHMRDVVVPSDTVILR